MSSENWNLSFLPSLQAGNTTLSWNARAAQKGKAMAKTAEDQGPEADWQEVFIINILIREMLFLPWISSCGKQISIDAPGVVMFKG